MLPNINFLRETFESLRYNNLGHVDEYFQSNLQKKYF